MGTPKMRLLRTYHGYPAAENATTTYNGGDRINPRKGRQGRTGTGKVNQYSFPTGNKNNSTWERGRRAEEDGGRKWKKGLEK